MNTHRLLVLALLVSAAASAQPGGPEGPRGWQRSVERIEHLKKVRLVEMLDLTEEQSVRFFARRNDHENIMQSLMKEKNDRLDRIERMVRNAADPADIEKAFPEVLAAEAQLHQERERFFRSLSDLLTAEQRAKFLLFERQFERELREAMRDARQRRYRGAEGE
jgi:Spy/CpxP family protein refolding chaperone